ncbi:MAG: exodeoxyribonuclease V subunit gamma, partial [Verrucomicrobiota bacterium]
LARLYDEYLVYRPEQIINWEDAPIPGYDWQGEIWKRLSRAHYPNRKQPSHVARLWRRLHLLEASPPEPNLELWPERLLIFGVSSLAPIYLDFLDYLSRFRPVHIFLLQPSNLYWADLKSTKEIAKISARQPTPRESEEIVPEEWIHDDGNPLLPSLGKQSQIFLDSIIDRDPIQDDFGFSEPAAHTQLSTLQSDLFELVDRSSPAVNSPFPSFDGTLQFHNASSRRREIESLWDYLVHQLDAFPDLQAADILVMAPDIQAYSSHIDAIFTPQKDAPLEIPYSIADRASHKTSPVLSGFADLIQTATGRATSKEILSLLAQPLFRETFQFSDNDLDAIESWIRRLGITWGWDAKHRQQNGAFATDRNTWRELRNRIAAGLCFGVENAFDASHAFPPYTELEGEFGETAGRFLECLELILDIRESQNQRLALPDWRKRILGAFERLKTKKEEWSQDFRSVDSLILETLPDLPKLMAAGSDVSQALLEKLEQSPSRSGYLSGGVTFCSLKPMRAIPAKIICLIGMNYADFPRKTTRLNFDLLAAQVRRGDRNTRDEDRQFFLETLLSARQNLYVSYLGLSQTSDEQKEPSSVVAELLNYLEQALGDDEYAKLLFRHPRQSYAPSYFANRNLFTYNPSRSALHNHFRIKPSKQESGAPSSPPPPASESLDEVQVDELISFFANPSKHYLERTAKAKISRETEDIEELDTLDYTGLDRFQFRRDLAQRIQARRDIGEISQPEIRSAKLLPPGKLELTKLRDEIDNASPIAAILQEALGERPIENVRIRLRFSETSLLGSLQTHRGTADQTALNPGSWNGSRLLEIWIRHLIACRFAALQGLPPPQLTALSFQSESKPFILNPVQDAAEGIQYLLNLYREGLSQPAPLFPNLLRLTFEKWVKPSRKNQQLDETSLKAALFKETQDALQSAVSRTQLKFGPKFEWSDYDRLCFGNDFELPHDYLELSRRIWTPFHEAQEPLNLASAL